MTTAKNLPTVSVRRKMGSESDRVNSRRVRLPENSTGSSASTLSASTHRVNRLRWRFSSKGRTKNTASPDRIGRSTGTSRYQEPIIMIPPRHHLAEHRKTRGNGLNEVLGE